MRWLTCFLVFGWSASATSWADCPIGNLRSPPLSQHVMQAKVIFIGKVLATKLTVEANKQPSAGTSEIEVLEVIRDHPVLPKKRLTVDTYLPLHVNSSFLILCDVFKGQLDPFHGRAIKLNSEVLRYVKTAPVWKNDAMPRERAQRLPFFFNYLEHPEELIAEDAFNEWADVTSAAMAMAARNLPAGSAPKLRAWLKNPKTPPNRIGLCAFLLGCISDEREKDSDLIRSLIEVDPEKAKGVYYEGLMAGYLRLVPGEKTWRWYGQMASQGQVSFIHRFSILRFLRFQESLTPLESRRHAVDVLKPMLDQDDFSDLAIEQLRNWGLWTHSDKILQLYAREPHLPPITNRAIVRYALCCPQPACRQFIENLRRQGPELVQDLEEALRLEKSNRQPNP